MGQDTVLSNTLAQNLQDQLHNTSFQAASNLNLNRYEFKDLYSQQLNLNFWPGDNTHELEQLHLKAEIIPSNSTRKKIDFKNIVEQAQARHKLNPYIPLDELITPQNRNTIKYLAEKHELKKQIIHFSIKKKNRPKKCFIA